MKDRTNHSGRNIKNRNAEKVENYPDTQKLNGKYNRSYQSHTSRAHNNSSN